MTTICLSNLFQKVEGFVILIDYKQNALVTNWIPQQINLEK